MKFYTNPTLCVLALDASDVVATSVAQSVGVLPELDWNLDGIPDGLEEL